MRKLPWALVAALGMTVIFRPGFAQTAVIPPAASEAQTITAENQAEAALRQHGLTAIDRLGLVGDYWEAAGLYRGEPVVAYLYQDGRLQLRRYSTGDLMAAFGALPRPGSSRKETAQLPQ